MTSRGAALCLLAALALPAAAQTRPSQCQKCSSVTNQNTCQRACKAWCAWDVWRGGKSQCYEKGTQPPQCKDCEKVVNTDGGRTCNGVCRNWCAWDLWAGAKGKGKSQCYEKGEQPPQCGDCAKVLKKGTCDGSCKEWCEWDSSEKVKCQEKVSSVLVIVLVVVGVLLCCSCAAAAYFVLWPKYKASQEEDQKASFADSPPGSYEHMGDVNGGSM